MEVPHVVGLLRVDEILRVGHPDEAVDPVIPFGVVRLGDEEDNVECAVFLDQCLILELTVIGEDPSCERACILLIVDIVIELDLELA